jgi:prepilin-type N-terminal cleavage/methylation domain-containing protein
MKKAFSLIELSIVILIIGILIAGVTQSSRILTQAKLTTARNLTTSAPVGSISNLMFWLDATSEKSFIDTETTDASSISNWYDINPQNQTPYTFQQNTAANKPTYKASCINGIPCLTFDGSSDYLTATQNINTLTNPLTIFMVVTTPTAWGSTDTTTSSVLSGEIPWIRFYVNGKLLYQVDQSNSLGIIYTSSTTAASTATNYIATIVDNNTTVYEYLNGTVTNASGFASSATKAISQLTLRIGATHATVSDLTSYYNGSIAEIIVYSRGLKTEERQSVEKYLSQKWGIKLSYS